MYRVCWLTSRREYLGQLFPPRATYTTLRPRKLSGELSSRRRAAQRNYVSGDDGRTRRSSQLRSQKAIGRTSGETSAQDAPDLDAEGSRDTSSSSRQLIKTNASDDGLPLRHVEAASHYLVRRVPNQNEHDIDHSTPGSLNRVVTGVVNSFSKYHQNNFQPSDLRHRPNSAATNEEHIFQIANVGGTDGAEQSRKSLLLHASGARQEDHQSVIGDPEVSSLANEPTNATSSSTKLAKPDLLNCKSSTRSKLDLSNHSIRGWERSPSKSHPPRSLRNSSKFRANTGLRQILGDFLSHIQDQHGTISHGIPAPGVAMTDRQIKEIFSPASLQFLEQRGYGPDHVLAWASILTAPTSSHQIKKFVLLCQQNRSRGESPPPSFVLLQLLRADAIDATALTMLWTEVVSSFCQVPTVKWNMDSATIFLIRMIRHARMVDVGLYEEIADFASKMLTQLLQHKAQESSRLKKTTHFFNRFLSLIALPTPFRPFRSVPMQQRAQLKIARHMYEHKPPIAVNREGYRAFTKLQLMHSKTSDEKEWARVKAMSWPPWRRDQLGIQESMNYQGQQSRTMKVLQRMKESGYGPASFEATAQVLAGWDTDRSPTIQVRRILKSRPMSWIREIFSSTEVVNHDTDHHTWAARVEATRSTREAWSCFHAYTEATKNTQRKLVVYEAMFGKLLAKSLVMGGVTSDYLPGDGKEVFLDPVSSRDLVYVPTEPPSVDELYTQMIDDNIKPAGRLLSNLVALAPTVEQGCQYIEDSALDELKTDILLHAEKYPRAMLQGTLRRLPNHLFCAVLVNFSQARHLGERALRQPGSLSTDLVYAGECRTNAFWYAQKLLELCETNYLPAYHALLEAVKRRCRASPAAFRDHNVHSGQSVLNVWNSTMRCLAQAQRCSVSFRSSTVFLVTSIIRSAKVHRLDQVKDGQSICQQMSSVISSLFYSAVTGCAVEEVDWEGAAQHPRLEQIPATKVSPNLLPTCKELESMFLTYGILNDDTSAMQLLEWVSAGSLTAIVSEARPRALKGMMIAIRVTFENFYIDVGGRDGYQIDTAKARQMHRVMDLCRDLGWPTDSELEEFARGRVVKP